MDMFPHFFQLLLDKLDLDFILVVQGVTALVRTLMNLRWKRAYTDFWAPFVSVFVGQVVAYAQNGVGLNQVIYGFKLGGMAIMFAKLYESYLEGKTWFKFGTNDPVLAAKVSQTEEQTDAQISAVKNLLSKNG